MDKKYTVLIVSSSEKSTDFIKRSGADAEVFEKPETSTTADYGAACLLIVKKEDYKESVADVEPYGTACISKPMSREAISQASRILIAMKSIIDNSGKKTETLKTEVAELKIVDRAKFLLMEKLGLSEEEAHKHLEKQAMDLCIRKSDAAKRVIMTYEM